MDGSQATASRSAAPVKTIYALVDPRDGRPRYVGQSRNALRRLREHGKADGPVQRWIAELKVGRQSPRVMTLEEVRSEDANLRERFWIASFARDGHELLNRQLPTSPAPATVASCRPSGDGSRLSIALERLRAASERFCADPAPWSEKYERLMQEQARIRTEAFARAAA